MRCSHILVACLGLFVLVAAAGRQPVNREELEKRRQRLEQMSDAEKTVLLQKKRRFDELPASEQDRLRNLHTKLASHQQRASVLTSLR